MYCHNQLLHHPLVSPVNAATLAGLPPLYIVRFRALSTRPYCTSALVLIERAKCHSAAAVRNSFATRSWFVEVRVACPRMKIADLKDLARSTSRTKLQIRLRTHLRPGFSKSTRRKELNSTTSTRRLGSSCKSLTAVAMLRPLCRSRAWPNTCVGESAAFLRLLRQRQADLSGSHRCFVAPQTLVSHSSRKRSSARQKNRLAIARQTVTQRTVLQTEPTAGQRRLTRRRSTFLSRTIPTARVRPRRLSRPSRPIRKKLLQGQRSLSESARPATSRRSRTTGRTTAVRRT